MTDQIVEELSAWRFPASTCEVFRDDNFFHQPVSAIINIISALLISFMLWQASKEKDKVGRISMCSVFFFAAIFEIIHTISHTLVWEWIPLTIHCTAVAAALSIHWYFVTTLGMVENKFILAMLVGSFILDSLIVLTVGTSFWSLLSTVVFLQLILMAYLPRMSRESTLKASKIVVSALSQVCLIGNEAVNCEFMLKHLPFAPHAIIELTGILFFVWLGDFLWSVKPHKEVSKTL